MRPIPAQRIGHSHGLLRALDQRGSLRLEEFVTEFEEADLFPPEVEGGAGRTRQCVAYARAAGLAVEERGAVELTDFGRRYVKAGDPEDVFAVSAGQAEWLRRQLYDRHLTDSIWHGAAIGLSLWASLRDGEWVALIDFGRAAAHLGRAGWDNDNTFQMQGERLTRLLADMELIDESRRLTQTGEETRGQLRLPLHMGVRDLAAQLNPGGPEGAAAAADDERAELGLEPIAAAAPAEPEETVVPGADGDGDGEGEWLTAVRPAVSAQESVEASATPAPPQDPPAPSQDVPAAPQDVPAAPQDVPAAPQDVPAAPPPAASPQDPPAPPPPSPGPPPPQTPPPAPSVGPIEAAALAAAAGAPAAAPAPSSPEPSAPDPQPAAPAPDPQPAAPAPDPQPAAPAATPQVSVRPTVALTALRPEDLAAWQAEQAAGDEPGDGGAQAGPFLDIAAVRSAGEGRGLVVDDGVYAAAIAALASGRHLVLTGGAGSGKTELALALAEAAVGAGRAEGAVFTSAGAGMGARETLGRRSGDGWQPGLVPDAMARNRWLIVDELDRARLDRALGRVSTLLAGQPMDLPDGRTLEPPEGWRLLATMADLGQVGRTTAALRRRFVFVEVPALEAQQLAELVERWADGDEVALAVGRRLVAVTAIAELGPGLFRDAVAYVRARRRLAPADETALTLEALAGFVLPQLEGAGETAAADAVKAAGLGG